jgi:hypothetical protein
LHLPPKKQHTPLLQQEGYQIYLLHDRMNAYTKEEGDSTTTIPTTKMNISHQILPTTITWKVNKKAEAMPQIRSGVGASPTSPQH